MITLKIIRKTPNSIEQKWTDGILFYKVNDNKFVEFCYTLEDQTRDINKSGKFDDEEKKIYGKTSIPFGKYEGEITYSPHFKRKMPAIFNVEGFSGIRLHGGNTPTDTLGCILVAYHTNNKGLIWDSAEKDLTKLIEENSKDNKFKIQIL